MSAAPINLAPTVKPAPASTPGAHQGGAHHAHASRHAKLVEQSRKLVAQTFFGTLLKQMHESPFKDKLFSGGRGGEAFGAMLDQHLAEKMVRGAGSKLVNSLVKHIEKNFADKSEAGQEQLNKTRLLVNQNAYPTPATIEGGSHVTADWRA